MRILNDLTLGTFDLHIHSTASDGVYSPAALVKKAKQAGLTTIALTDHDTLAGVEEAQRAGTESGVHVISGVEISTTYRGTNIDVLGYNIRHRQQLHDFLSIFRAYRKTRALKMIKKLAALNMPITLDEVLEFSRGDVIARPHIAKALVKKGYIDDYQQAFDDYLASGKPAAVEKKELPLVTAIDMIRQTGGQSVLAHPGYIKDKKCLLAILQTGLDGIEVWHRNHTNNDTKRFLDVANDLHLLVTGGSDFHSDEHQLGLYPK